MQRSKIFMENLVRDISHFCVSYEFLNDQIVEYLTVGLKKKKINKKQTKSMIIRA